MGKEAYLSAIGGLLHDPLLSQSDQWIPTGWENNASENVALASRLAAGAVQDGPRTAATGPLKSILTSIQTKGDPAQAGAYWPIGSLDLEKTPPFPIAKQSDVAAARSELLAALGKEATELKVAYGQAAEDDLLSYVENLMLLLQRYTWCLPSAYLNEIPDASLYDHSRMTAALSAIFAQQPPSDKLRKNPANSEEPVALLVGGDISGIQDFIYQVSSRGATPAMRGRSFYLQLLGEVIPRFLLRHADIDLPITNLIYAGGGHFFMLIRPDQQATLDALRAEISRVLLYHHRGDLYLAIASVPILGKDFFGKGIARKWEELRGALQGAKLHRFSELGADLDGLFEPKDHGGNEEKQCQVCGLEHPQTELIRRDTNDDGIRKCPVCISYEDLGDDLRAADWLVLGQVKPMPLPDLTGEWIPGDWEKVLAQFGSRVTVTGELPKVSGRATILALGDHVGKFVPTAKLAVGRRFLVNVTPILTDEDKHAVADKLSDQELKDLPPAGSVKPFDVLEKQSQGIPRLGILRMDVDNMGDMFTDGLGDKASLARLAALSFSVQLFFEGWVAHLAEERNRQDKQAGRGERLYSIYSGGDDLFFVGSWDAVAELAIQIRAELGRFTNYHPGVHASAGIVLVGGKYPLAQAAQDAGRAEEEAKQYVWYSANGSRHTKDAITFLGQTMPWSQFGTHECSDMTKQTVHAWFHRLDEALWLEDAPWSVLNLLMQLQAQYVSASNKRRMQGTSFNKEGKPQAVWGSWNWLGVYYLRRMQRGLSEPAFKDMLQDILSLFQSGDLSSVWWIGLAARWTELFTR